MVYGSRFQGSAAGLYYTHRVANRLLNLMVNVAFNRYLSDVYTGYKVFTRQAYRGLRLTARTFTVEMELTAHFLRKGLIIYEVPISYRAGPTPRARRSTSRTASWPPGRWPATASPPPGGPARPPTAPPTSRE